MAERDVIWWKLRRDAEFYSVLGAYEWDNLSLLYMYIADSRSYILYPVGYPNPNLYCRLLYPVRVGCDSLRSILGAADLIRRIWEYEFILLIGQFGRYSWYTYLDKGMRLWEEGNVSFIDETRTRREEATPRFLIICLLDCYPIRKNNISLKSVKKYLLTPAAVWLTSLKTVVARVPYPRIPNQGAWRERHQP